MTVAAKRSDAKGAAKAAAGKGSSSEASDETGGFSEGDVQHIEDHAKLRSPLIYEIVRREGEEEMARPTTSLWWSGVAGGLSISFSLLAQAVLLSALPDAPWRSLVTDFGYCFGFVIVVLARQQLFTETTITAVLPVVAQPTAANFGRMARLWGVVLAANLAGTLLAALFFSLTPAIGPDLRAAMLEVSGHIMAGGPLAVFCKAVCAGFLMAAMVWLIPSAEGAKFYVIVLMTYLISLGGFTHIVAGSMEAWMLALSDPGRAAALATGFGLPVLAGNIVGGTALFALLSYAQVAKEI